MDLPNSVTKLDVSGVAGIAEALDIAVSYRDYEGQPLGDPTKEFDLRTHGALQLTLSNGTVLVIGTSEWCTVSYYAPKPEVPGSYEELEQWKRQGEAILSGRRLGIFFRLGLWWAHRPWGRKTSNRGR